MDKAGAMIGLDDMQVTQSGNQVSMTATVRTRDLADQIQNGPGRFFLGGGGFGNNNNPGVGIPKIQTDPIWNLTLSGGQQEERTMTFNPGEEINIRVHAFPQGTSTTPPDVDLFVYRSGSNIIRHRDDGPGTNCNVSFRNTSATPYRVQVRNQGNGLIRGSVIITRRTN